MTQSTPVNTAAPTAASTEEVKAAKSKRTKLIVQVAIIVAVTLILWFVPAPKASTRAACTCSPSSSAPSSA